MIQTNKIWNDFDKLSQHNCGGGGNRTIASLFEMQGTPSAVNMLLLKISTCSFYQLCNFTLASQEISGVWFFKKTFGCSALQGGGKKEGKRRLEQRKSLLALGFNSDISGSCFNHTFLHELGETKAQALQKLQVSSLNLYNLRNLNFCSHVVLPLIEKIKQKEKKTITKRKKGRPCFFINSPYPSQMHLFFWAEKLMCFFQSRLHVLIFCKLASILQLQPLESLVLLRELYFCVTVLHFCQPVNNGLRFAMGRIAQFFLVPLYEGELTGLKTSLLLCFPEGCLQVILSWVHMACQEGEKVNCWEGNSDFVSFT